MFRADPVLGDPRVLVPSGPSSSLCTKCLTCRGASQPPRVLCGQPHRAGLWGGLSSAAKDTGPRYIPCKRDTDWEFGLICLRPRPPWGWGSWYVLGFVLAHMGGCRSLEGPAAGTCTSYLWREAQGPPGAQAPPRPVLPARLLPIKKNSSLALTSSNLFCLLFNPQLVRSRCLLLLPSHKCLLPDPGLTVGLVWSLQSFSALLTQCYLC